MMRNLLIFALCVWSLGPLHSSYAQDMATPGLPLPVPTAQEDVQVIGQAPTESGVEKENVAAQSSEEALIKEQASLLFTDEELSAIDEARRVRELMKDHPELQEQKDVPVEELLPIVEEAPKPPPPPETRYIRLGGVAYTSTKDWTIWINETRVTPGQKLPEMRELDVHEDHVHMMWFDEYLNEIVPIRLQPHQRFHLDTRAFSPIQ